MGDLPASGWHDDAKGERTGPRVKEKTYAVIPVPWFRGELSTITHCP